MNQFHLQAQADHLYATQPRQLAFRAETLDAFAAWQDTLRARVRALLGIAGRVLPTAIKAEPVQAIERDGYTEEKYALDVGDGAPAPMYVLVPHADPPYKPVMVFHGHNPSAQYILGNYPDEATARHWRALDDNYAQALAQAGYLVCAVEQRGFGERVSDQLNPVDDLQSACRHLSFAYLMQGRTMIGERVWDGMVALSYMQARPDAQPGIMGCTGHSGGGTTTLWLSALDERVTVCVPSCYFCSFKHSILGVRHCECNYVPGILEYAEMGDLAALLAPRPVRIIAGERDPIFPVEGVRQQFETLRRAYGLHDAEDRCSLAVHPGEHAYNRALSHEWFARWLT
jgi:dienelactone hydrolase